MKKFIKISSTKNICVTSGLGYIDNTNPDARVADRLKVSSTWAKTKVMLTVGSHWYPSEITTWNTVKKLVADGIVTISVETSDDPIITDEAEKAKVLELKQRLEREKLNIEKRRAANKAVARQQKLEDTDDATSRVLGD